MLDTMHICLDCEKEFIGCKAARYCYDCRRRRVGESARTRRLCDIGGRARWEKARGLKKEETDSSATPQNDRRKPNDD